MLVSQVPLILSSRFFENFRLKLYHCCMSSNTVTCRSALVRSGCRPTKKRAAFIAARFVANTYLGSGACCFYSVYHRVTCSDSSAAALCSLLHPLLICRLRYIRLRIAVSPKYPSAALRGIHAGLLARRSPQIFSLPGVHNSSDIVENPLAAYSGGTAPDSHRFPFSPPGRAVKHTRFKAHESLSY